jgi:hypothetical protein
MGALTVRWAVLGKTPKSGLDYETTATSHPAQGRQFAKILSAFTPGTSPNSALPRVSTSYFSETEGDRKKTPMVGLSLQKVSKGAQDGFERDTTATFFVCAKWADFCAAHASYLTLYQAIRDIDLSTLGSRPLKLELDPYPLDDFGAAVTPLARQAAALLLAEQQICVTGTGHLPADTRLETRLAFLDTVATLLPYGFRSSLAVSTWTGSSAQHQIKLSFAAVAPAWAGELRWSDEGAQVEPPIDVPGKERYGRYVAELNDLKDPVLLGEVIARLRMSTEPLSLKRPTDLDNARAFLVTAVSEARKVLNPAPRAAENLSAEIPATKSTSTELAIREPAGIGLAFREPAGTGPDRGPHGGFGARNFAPLAEHVAAGLADLRLENRSGLVAAAQACMRLNVTDADRLAARKAIRLHASAFQLQPSPALLDDVTRFLRVMLGLVYGERPNAQGIDDLAADLEGAPSQSLIGAVESAFRPTPAGEILLTGFLYSDAAGARSVSVDQVVAALAEEPHQRLLEIARVVLRKTPPTEARVVLENHGYLAEAVESAPAQSRHELYRFLLTAAYRGALATADVEDVVARSGYPSAHLMAAIFDVAADDVDWTTVSVALRAGAIAAVNRRGDTDGGGHPEPARAPAEAAWVTIKRRARRLPRWSGWCAAALATMLLIVSLLWPTGSAPTSVSGPAGAPATGPLATSSGEAVAPTLPVAPPPPTNLGAPPPPLPVPWPLYTVEAAGDRGVRPLNRWINAMNSRKCDLIGRLKPAGNQTARVYEGLQAACESTTFGGHDRWDEAQRAADTVRGIPDDCMDKLAARLLKALTEAHRTNPGVPIQLTFGQKPTPVPCTATPPQK